jgi:hypothetical protein
MSHGIAFVLREVHDGEVALERELHHAAERHQAEHEVRHVALDLARWSLQNRQALAPLAGRFAVGELTGELDPQTSAGPVTALRERASELLGRRPEPGLLLLYDLRQLLLLASGNSVLWTMLGQAAQVSKDGQLLDIVTACHGRTTRQVAWCNAQIKTVSTQALIAT